jgi:hypothetical protein
MKYFNIFKNTSKKEGSTAPDYRISVNIGTKENPENVEAGGCWLKDMKSGGKYFSCKLSDLYVDKEKGTARQGFDLVAEPIVEEKKEPCLDENGRDCSPDLIPF